MKVLDELPKKARTFSWPKTIERALKLGQGRWIQMRRYKNPNSAGVAAAYLRRTYANNGYGQLEFHSRGQYVYMQAARTRKRRAQ